MIKTGTRTRPQKIVLYGIEGVGKSSLAAQFPNPVAIDVEGGTDHLDVARLEPGGLPCRTIPQVKAAVKWLLTQAHDFKTVFIDTIDWCEKAFAEAVISDANSDKIKSIEDFGYGKGYVLLGERVMDFLSELDELRTKRGMHVVLLSHSTVKKFEQPDAAGAYDRYELKLSKHVAPIIREWPDALLFLNFKTRVVEKDGRNRAVGGKERVILTEHTAAFDAKNRHGLKAELPMCIESLAPLLGGTGTVQAATPPPQTSDSREGLLTKAAAIIGTHGDDVTTFLRGRQVIAEGEDWRAVGDSYLARIVRHPVEFMRSVAEAKATAEPAQETPAA